MAAAAAVAPAVATVDASTQTAMEERIHAFGLSGLEDKEDQAELARAFVRERIQSHEEIHELSGQDLRSMGVTLGATFRFLKLQGTGWWRPRQQMALPVEPVVAKVEPVATSSVTAERREVPSMAERVAEIRKLMAEAKKEKDDAAAAAAVAAAAASETTFVPIEPL